MLVMTAKVDKKKIFIALAAAGLLIVGLVLLLGGGNADTEPTAALSLASNEGRVKFLEDLGWKVTPAPKESGQVRIPKDTTEVFDRYNALQKSQGYDLSKYAGKTVMRYVYAIENYPGATEPVYATLLICKDQVIGGDVTNTAANGAMHGLAMPKNPQAKPQTVPTLPQPSEASSEQPSEPQAPSQPAEAESKE